MGEVNGSNPAAVVILQELTVRQHKFRQGMLPPENLNCVAISVPALYEQQVSNIMLLTTVVRGCLNRNVLLRVVPC